MVGGHGNDTYQFLSPKAAQVVEIDDEGGVDTIDLSGMNHGQGIQGFDLDQSMIQMQGLTLSDLTILQLLSSNSIDNVIGTNAADSIFGNLLPNHLDGGGGDDRLEGRDGHDILVRQAELREVGRYTFIVLLAWM